jgi:hypothetical protein
MSNYTKTTNFAAKDSLPSGNANKIIKGTEHDTEYNNIATAISTKLDAASGTATNLNLSGFTLSSGTVSNLTTDLSVSDGGTGLSFATAGTVLLGNGSASLVTLSAGTAGNVLLSNGSAWTSSGLATGFSQAQVFTSSGTFTVPGSGRFKVTIVGGGGGGGSNSIGNAVGGSGAGGGTAIKWFTGATPGASATVTIGAGGAGNSGTNSGLAGGNSSFALSGFSTVTANGGSGGSSDGTVTVAGGSASNGDINITGQRGARNNPGNPDYASPSGGSLLGLGANDFGVGSNGLQGTGYGAGASGVRGVYGSLSGTNGICIVEY